MIDEAERNTIRETFASLKTSYIGGRGGVCCYPAWDDSPSAVLQGSMTSWAMCGSGQHRRTRPLTRTCVSSGEHPGLTQLMALPTTGPGSPPGKEPGVWGLRVGSWSEQCHSWYQHCFHASVRTEGWAQKRERAALAMRSKRAQGHLGLFLPALSTQRDFVSHTLFSFCSCPHNWLCGGRGWHGHVSRSWPGVMEIWTPQTGKHVKSHFL